MSAYSSTKTALQHAQAAVANALDLVRHGRLSVPHATPFHVVHTESTYSLRHYIAHVPQPKEGPTVLLVPPLMVTAEIYDMAQDISAVRVLLQNGIDVWVTDFRAPENEIGGFERTLDDHVLAVVDSVERVRSHTGQTVHLAGYSQGGMFAYQAAALRKSADIASIITFGSPVNMHAAIPFLSDATTARFTQLLGLVAAVPLARLPALPASWSSLGFRIIAFRKELRQFREFFSVIHDRAALERREPRRLFLRGRGFVSWPGPALRTFIDELVVANRMAKGGFSVAGTPVRLSDLTCPILIFVGTQDELAVPKTVRGIYTAAPYATIREETVAAGHLGLVIGTQAQEHTWPKVVSWLWEHHEELNT